MAMTREEINEIYESIKEMREKVIQAVKIKNKFDERRASLVNELKESLNHGVVDHRIIKSLLITYKREESFFKILEKGIKNIHKFRNEVDVLARQAGILKSISSFFRRKKQRTTLQSSAFVKYAYKITKKYSNKSEEEFNKVYSYFLEQYNLLKQIKKPANRQILTNFIELCENENLITKEFYKTKLNDRMMKIIYKVSPKQAAVLMIMLNLPASGQIIPFGTPFFGIQFAIILGVLAEVVKWIGVVGYSYYLAKMKI